MRMQCDYDNQHQESAPTHSRTSTDIHTRTLQPSEISVLAFNSGVVLLINIYPTNHRCVFLILGGAREGPHET